MTISAVITTYNRCELALQALASVQAQTRPPDEILIIDDGSTDATPDQFQAQQVRYHRQRNQGTSSARNSGWQLATGEWIAYLDCDDLWEKDKLACQEVASENDPRLEAIFGHAVNFADPSDLARFDPQKHRLDVALPGWLPGAALVRRSLLEAMGGFDPSIKTSEVVDWIMRLRLREARMRMLPAVVLRRRLHLGNKQLSSDLGRRENFALLRQWRARQSAAAQTAPAAPEKSANAG